jgi:hypothetical protein
VSKVVHTNLSPGVLVEACKRAGLSPGDSVTILPTETYRALAGLLECAPVIHQHPVSRAWAKKAREVLALLREADTEVKP